MMKRLILLLAALTFLLPGCAEAQRIRLLRSSATGMQLIPTSQTTTDGTLTPAGYGCFNPSYTGSGTLSISSETDGNHNPTTALILSHNDPGAVLCTTDKSNGGANFDGLVPTGTYGSGTPLSAVVSPITVVLTDGSGALGTGTVTVNLVANQITIAPDSRDTGSGFQFQAAYPNTIIGTSGAASTAIQEHCGTYNVASDIVATNLGYFVNMRATDANFTGANYISVTPDSPDCAVWAQLQLRASGTGGVNSHAYMHFVTPKFRGNPGALAVNTLAISGLLMNVSNPVSDVWVDTGDFESNPSKTLCGVNPNSSSCVNSGNSGGNILSGVLFVNGTNIKVTNTLINGVYTGVNFGGAGPSNPIAIGNTLTNVWEDVFHLTCATNIDIEWNYATDKKDDGFAHGDFIQDNFSTNCLPAAGAYAEGKISGNVAYDGEFISGVSGSFQGIFINGIDGTPSPGASFTGFVSRGNTFISSLGNGILYSNFVTPDSSFNTIIGNPKLIGTGTYADPTWNIGQAGTFPLAVAGTQEYNAQITTGTILAGTVTTGSVNVPDANVSTAYVAPAINGASLTLAQVQAAMMPKAGGPLDPAVTGKPAWAGAGMYFNYVTRTDSSPAIP